MTQALACPRCRVSPLLDVDVQGRSVHLCSRCGGVWLARSTATVVDDALEHTSFQAAKRAAMLAPAKKPDVGRAVCPLCSRDLVIHDIAGVEVDVCDDHGAWYDRDELPRIAERLPGRRTPVAVPALRTKPAVATAGAASVALLASTHERPQRRDGETTTADMFSSAADGVEALEVMSQIGSVALDVAGTVAQTSLEIVGAIFLGLFEI